MLMNSAEESTVNNINISNGSDGNRLKRRRILSNASEKSIKPQIVPEIVNGTEVENYDEKPITIKYKTILDYMDDEDDEETDESYEMSASSSSVADESGSQVSSREEEMMINSVSQNAQNNSPLQSAASSATSMNTVVNASSNAIIDQSAFRINSVQQPSGLVYDPRLLAHAPLKREDFDHPENPDRLRKIYDALKTSGLLYNFKRIAVKNAEKAEILRFHTPRHCAYLENTKDDDTETLIKKAQEFNSIYLNSQSYFCALLSCGGVLALVDSVWNNEVKNGFAIVRPPGHHAEPDEPMGFCLCNNVAIAAMHLKAQYGAKKIAIVDWDIHHGNGTQTAFYSDPDVLFISLHRFDNGKFYPSFKSADLTYVGDSGAEGKNINIPWPCGGFGDADYIYAFQKIVIPVLTEFQPEIILVSCGFDAAKNDPIGDCDVTPEGYEHMTYMLSQLANGKVVLALEGGYHLESVANSSVSCARILLGESPRPIRDPNNVSLEFCDEVIKIHSKYWRCFGSYYVSADMLRKIATKKEDSPNREEFSIQATLNSLAIVPIRDIIRSYRNLRLRQMYAMSPITQLFGPETESFADVNVTSDIFTAKTSILFVHESPCVRGTTTISENMMDLNSSVMVDETLPYIDSFLSKRWGLIDVNLRIQDKGYFPDRYQRLRPYSLREDTQDRQKVDRLLSDVYDRYVKSFTGKFFLIFLVGFPTGSVQRLLTKPHIDKEVETIVMILPPNASPPFMSSNEDPYKTSWFEQKSVILMPDESEPWSIVQFPRCGIIWSMGEPKEEKMESVTPTALLRRYYSQIMTILDGRWWW